MRSLRSFFVNVGAALLIGTAVLSFGSSAQALSLSPAILDLQAEPGETKTAAITLTNDESLPLIVSSSIQKFLPLGTSGQQRFLSPADLTGLPSWTLVGMSDQVWQPGETRTIPIQIRVPIEAERGGAYEALFFSGTPQTAGLGSEIGIRSRIGTLVLLTVGTSEATDAVVTEWQLLDPKIQSGVRGTVQLGLKNAGRTHVVPKGDVVVRGMLGNEVMRVPINPSGARILPASERVFDVSIGQPIRGQGRLGIGDELAALGLGRYAISLEGIEGLRQNPSPLRLTVIPWRSLILLFILLGGIVGLFRAYRRSLIRALGRPRG